MPDARFFPLSTSHSGSAGRYQTIGRSGCRHQMSGIAEHKRGAPLTRQVVQKRLYSLRSGGGYRGGRKIVFLKARGFRRMMAPFRVPFYNAAEPPPQPSARRAVKPKNPPAARPVNLKNLPIQPFYTTLLHNPAASAAAPAAKLPPFLFLRYPFPQKDYVIRES